VARYLLDTDVLIDHLKGRAPSVALIRSLQRDGHKLGVCCVNIAELYSGVAERDQYGAAELVDALDYFEVSRDAAQMAGEYRHRFARKGIQLSATDAITAATAVEYAATLVTGNIAHYPMQELLILKLPR